MTCRSTSQVDQTDSNQPLATTGFDIVIIMRAADDTSNIIKFHARLTIVIKALERYLIRLEFVIKLS